MGIFSVIAVLLMIVSFVIEWFIYFTDEEFYLLSQKNNKNDFKNLNSSNFLDNRPTFRQLKDACKNSTSDRKSLYYFIIALRIYVFCVVASIFIGAMGFLVHLLYKALSS